MTRHGETLLARLHSQGMTLEDAQRRYARRYPELVPKRFRKHRKPIFFTGYNTVSR